jgi:hypothetical protein
VIKLRRIKISSAFKVGAIVSGLQYMIFGLLFLALQYAYINALFNVLAAQARSPQVGGSTASFFIPLLFFYGCGIPVVGVFGGISWALGAFFYNLAARFVGGVEIMIDYYDLNQEQV